MDGNNTLSGKSGISAKMAFAFTALILFAGIANAANTGGNVPLSAPTLSINGTSFGTGNIITLNAFVAGGKGPYTYNFIIENASTGSVLISSGPMVNSNTFSIATNPYLNGGDMAFVGVTDSSSPAVSVASPQVGFSVNATMNVINNPQVGSNNSYPQNTNQTAAVSAPPGSTNAIGAGIVVIILITVIGIFIYGKKGRK